MARAHEVAEARGVVLEGPRPVHAADTPRQSLRSEVPATIARQRSPEPASEPRQRSPEPASETRQRVAEAAPEARQGGTGGGGSPAGPGWLSGLAALSLARRRSRGASAGERGGRRQGGAEPRAVATPRTGRGADDSLDSLAVDIAGMIDHQAVMELWERHEPKPKPPRHGQALYGARPADVRGHPPQIRRRARLPADGGSLHRRVERLLADVARNDPQRTLTRTCTSPRRTEAETHDARARRGQVRLRAILLPSSPREGRGCLHGMPPHPKHEGRPCPPSTGSCASASPVGGRSSPWRSSPSCSCMRWTCRAS